MSRNTALNFEITSRLLPLLVLTAAAAGGVGSCACDDPPPGQCREVDDCDDPGPCESRDLVTCDEGRCVYKAKGAGEQCNDGDICTVNDVCDDAGQCGGVPRLCNEPPAPACVDDDAVYEAHYGLGTCYDDGRGCVYQVFRSDCPSCSSTCLPACNAAYCPAEEGGCRAGYCDPAQAPSCQYENVADGTPCQLPSGGVGSCGAGRCVECELDADCDDGNSCTRDSCSADRLCVRETTDGAVCDDGDSCTRDDRCFGTTCLGQWFPCTCTTAIDCDDLNPCTSETCNAQGNCVFSDVTGACDDGQPCTSNDLCQAGVCTGTVYSCDDQNACTQDVCLGDGQCSHDVVGSCDDGDPCTHSDTCDSQGLCAGTPYTCPDDGDSCSTVSCDGFGGCDVMQHSGSCDDHDACTFADLCQNGVCAGTPIVCVSDVCTTRACDGSSTCVELFNDAVACDDGMACTRDDVCAAGQCAGVDYLCDDGCALTADVCDGTGGCEHPNVVLDQSSHARVDDGAGLSWSHTTGALSSGLLLVGIATYGSAGMAQATTVLYAGQPLSFVGAVERGTLRAELWTLLAPPQGSGQISVTFDGPGAAVGGASTWDNVDQVRPHGGFVSAEGSSGPSALTLASSAEQLVVDVFGARLYGSAAPLLNEDARQSLLWFEGETLAAGSSFAPGSSGVELGWELESFEWVHGAIALAPATITDALCTPISRSVVDPAASACTDIATGAACVASHDPDCDGLLNPPFGGDPWPGATNALLLGEDFSASPASSGRWQSTGPCQHDPVSAALDANAGCSFSLEQVCAAALDTPDYLVELRFTVSAIEDPSSWEVQLESAEADTFGGRRCELVLGSSNPEPGIFIHWRGSGQGSYGPPALTVAPGSSYVLQSWATTGDPGTVKYHSCRLLDGDGVAVLRDTTKQSDLAGNPQPGTITVSTSNISIAVDSVRAYRNP